MSEKSENGITISHSRRQRIQMTCFVSIQFIIIYDKEKEQILTFEKLKNKRVFRHNSLENDWND